MFCFPNLNGISEAVSSQWWSFGIGEGRGIVLGSGCLKRPFSPPSIQPTPLSVSYPPVHPIPRATPRSGLAEASCQPFRTQTYDFFSCHYQKLFFTSLVTNERLIIQEAITSITLCVSARGPVLCISAVRQRKRSWLAHTIRLVLTAHVHSADYAHSG